MLLFSSKDDNIAHWRYNLYSVQVWCLFNASLDQRLIDIYDKMKYNFCMLGNLLVHNTIRIS